MTEIDEIIKALKSITDTKTDKELSEFLEVPYKTFSMWKYRGEIPANKILEFSKKLGVSMDTILGNNVKVVGDGNVTFGGNGNFIAESKDSKLQSKIFKEFIGLYVEYGNDKLLMPVIEKLKEIEQIIQK